MEFVLPCIYPPIGNPFVCLSSVEYIGIITNELNHHWKQHEYSSIRFSIQLERRIFAFWTCSWYTIGKTTSGKTTELCYNRGNQLCIRRMRLWADVFSGPAWKSINIVRVNEFLHATHNDMSSLSKTLELAENNTDLASRILAMQIILHPHKQPKTYGVGIQRQESHNDEGFHLF